MKKILFWILYLPLGAVILIAGILQFLLHFLFLHFSACCEVVNVLLDRWEYWAFDVEPDAFINSPFRHSLVDVYLRELSGEIE